MFGAYRVILVGTVSSIQEMTIVIAYQRSQSPYRQSECYIEPAPQPCVVHKGSEPDAFGPHLDSAAT